MSETVIKVRYCNLCKRHHCKFHCPYCGSIRFKGRYWNVKTALEVVPGTPSKLFRNEGLTQVEIVTLLKRLGRLRT